MRRLLAVLVCVMIGVLFIQEIQAIPAFARKYRMSCKTCHAPFPRLKPYGDDFAGNAFKLSDEKSPGYFVDTGDEELSLLRNFPVAARLEGFINYDGSNEQSDFGTPWGVKLLTGGEITDDIAFYFYFYMDERGEVAGVEDAFIMFNDLFNIDLDVYAGQFQVSDPLFKRELRLELEDYHIYKAAPGLSTANLTYDKGIMITLGLDWGTDIIFEVVNGNGIVEANAANLFDRDDYKSFVGRISQDIGEFARIGAFAYTGSENQLPNAGQEFKNTVLMWGPDATFSIGDIIELNLQYIMRNDDNLLLTEGATTPYIDFRTEGGLAELLIMPKGDDSKIYGAALVNFIESDEKIMDYKTAALHVGYVLRRNLRLVGEYRYNFTDEDNPFNIFSIGFVSAF